MARIQEEELEFQKSKPKFQRFVHHQSSLPTASPIPPVQKKNTDDFGRERQLRDYHRANGLCFRCGEKYSKEHQCKKPMQLLTIQLGEHGEILTEDAVQALELLSEPEKLECCEISAHAVSGADNAETIRIRALVSNQVMLALVDSGSSHNFVDENFAKRASLDLVAVPSVQVTVANGQAMESKFQAPNLTWWAQGHTFETPMRVLQLGAYDAVLEMDWLKCHSPMTCDWEGKSLQFVHMML